jgi:hypothetical protein
MNTAFDIYAEYWTPSSDSGFSESVTYDLLEKNPRTLGSERTTVRPAETFHPLWVINVGEAILQLVKPIALRVQREGDRYFAENETLEVCSYGDSPKEALQDAMADIAYFYSFYSSLSNDEVMGHGIGLKQRYEQLVVR